MAITQQKLLKAQKKFWLASTPSESDYKEFAQTGTFPQYLYKKTASTSSKKNSVNDLTESDFKKIQEKYGLAKAPTKTDVQEFIDTGSFSSTLTWKNPALIRTVFDNNAGWKDSTSNETSNPYDARDQYTKNYIDSINAEFDSTTSQNMKSYDRTQTDYDTNINYYRQDFDRITSRRNQDYITGIALQNKKFSQSLDFVSNYVWRTIGSLSGIGKSRITNATQDKIENDARIQLNYDRANQDSQIDLSRQDARYKLGSVRLAEDKQNYSDQRDKEKKVMDIKAQGDVTQYYDTVTTDTVISEDAAAKRKKNIQWGGTGVETIFNN